jgi:hypothetical protein
MLLGRNKAKCITQFLTKKNFPASLTRTDTQKIYKSSFETNWAEKNRNKYKSRMGKGIMRQGILLNLFFYARIVSRLCTTHNRE